MCALPVLGTILHTVCRACKLLTVWKLDTEMIEPHGRDNRHILMCIDSFRANQPLASESHPSDNLIKGESSPYMIYISRYPHRLHREREAPERNRTSVRGNHKAIIHCTPLPNTYPHRSNHTHTSAVLPIISVIPRRTCQPLSCSDKTGRNLLQLNPTPQNPRRAYYESHPPSPTLG